MLIEKKYKLILDNLTSGIVTVSIDGNILYINPTAEKILHITLDESEGKNYREVFSHYPEIDNLIYTMIKENKTERRNEVVISHRKILLRIGYSTMQVKENENIVGYTIIFQDLSLVGGKDAK